MMMNLELLISATVLLQVAATAAQAADRVVITIGDSVAAGTGYSADPDSYPDSCYQDTTNAPGARLATLLNAESIFEACIAAHINGIQWQWERARDTYKEVSSNGDDDGFLNATIVVVAGINDVRSISSEAWIDVVKECSSSRNCHQDPANQIGNLESVKNDLVSLYDNIATDAPNAKIRVLGYPRPFQPWWMFCLWAPGISAGEARWMDDNADELN